jgi:RimJ/RimL family protein N-acetyltransferase
MIVMEATLRVIDDSTDVSLATRTACLDDEPALARLIIAAEEGSVKPEAALDAVQAFASGRDGKPLWTCTFVAESNAELISAVLSNERGGAAWLAYILTHPAYRKRGYATALIRRAMSAALALGYSTAHLKVASNNVATIRLYERLGFVAA